MHVCNPFVLSRVLLFVESFYRLRLKMSITIGEKKERKELEISTAMCTDRSLWEKNQLIEHGVDVCNHANHEIIAMVVISRGKYVVWFECYLLIWTWVVEKSWRSTRVYREGTTRVSTYSKSGLRCVHRAACTFCCSQQDIVARV